MSTSHRVIFALTILCKFVSSQRFIGDVCTLESNGAQGECKLFGDCPHARKQLQEQKIFPQTCGFQGTTPIVCCPKTEDRPQGRKPGVISKRKCREYARYAFETMKSPVLFLNEQTITNNECGHKVEKLIIGGQPAGRREFPHMAAIGFEPTPGDIQWLCGGTILSKEYILTAAHCLGDRTQGDALWVKLGATNLKDPGHAEQIKIVDRIAHPQYRSRSHYHDIALIKLEKPATLSSYARPACLYSEPEVSAEKAIATGWGQTSWGGNGSDKLLKVTLDLIKYDTCNPFYQNVDKLANGIAKDLQLCAGSNDAEKDTCQGDSGGPLQVYHVGDNIKCMYDIIGVTSFGKACALTPGVYARVSNYIKWIEDIVWP